MTCYFVEIGLGISLLILPMTKPNNAQKREENQTIRSGYLNLSACSGLEID